MKPTVYIETTIIGYLAMRVSGVLRIAANQQTTREWWDNHRQRFDLLISRFVVDECSVGDPVAARERLAFVQGGCTAYSRRNDQRSRIPADVELQAHRQPFDVASHRTHMP